MIINNEYRSAVVNLLRSFSDEGLYDEFDDWCHSCGPGKLADLIESGPSDRGRGSCPTALRGEDDE